MPGPGGYDLRNGELQGPTFLTVPGVAPVLRAAGVHNVVAASTAAVAPVLRAAGVHNVVAASTAAVAPDRHALSELLSLWHPGSHAFRLPAAPATFSLEDALLLVGLPPPAPRCAGSSPRPRRTSTLASSWRRRRSGRSTRAREPNPPRGGRRGRAITRPLVNNVRWSGASSSRRRTAP
ncbi:hypothetical protein ZWY2020_002955 [Hordeum vulgare]|nr:hypothetical protein ZWY2020_002955 [Hordeum vulgare]